MYIFVCVCRQEAGILMHNKFKRIDGIFAVVAALSHAFGVFVSETIFCLQKKFKSRNQIKTKLRYWWVSVRLSKWGWWGRENYIYGCNVVVVVVLFCQFSCFLSVCCTVIADPQIFRLLRLKFVFKIWFCYVDKPSIPYHSNSHIRMWPLCSILF